MHRICKSVYMWPEVTQFSVTSAKGHLQQVTSTEKPCARCKLEQMKHISLVVQQHRCVPHTQLLVRSLQHPWDLSSSTAQRIPAPLPRDGGSRRRWSRCRGDAVPCLEDSTFWEGREAAPRPPVPFSMGTSAQREERTRMQAGTAISSGPSVQ